MLPMRILADYNISAGKCLLLLGKENEGSAALTQSFVALTDLKLTAMYSSTVEQEKAEKRIRDVNLGQRVECCVGSLSNLPFDKEAFDLVVGTGPVLILEKDRVKAMMELYRILLDGGVCLIGGKFTGMPKHRRVAGDQLRRDAVRTGIPSIKVLDDMGQWIEIRKGIKDRKFRD